MLYFHSSKLALITKYNKYTTNEEYVKLFIDMLYKNKNELKKHDEEYCNLKLLNNNEYIDQVVLKNINKKTKNEIIEIINSNVNNNSELINKTSELKTIIDKDTNICEESKKNISSHLNSKMNCNYGVNTENSAIKLYEIETNNKVYDNNTKLYVNKYNLFAICGKTDGFVKIEDKEFIFETKNRKNRLFNDIPIYEKIQLLAYTYLCKNNNIVFVQCINNNINIKNLVNYNDDNLWNNVILKLSQYAMLINNLQTCNNLRSNFITLSDFELQFKFLQEYLNWL
jgi:hypothetical protein